MENVTQEVIPELSEQKEAKEKRLDAQRDHGCSQQSVAKIVVPVSPAAPPPPPQAVAAPPSPVPAPSSASVVPSVAVAAPATTFSPPSGTFHGIYPPTWPTTSCAHTQPTWSMLTTPTVSMYLIAYLQPAPMPPMLPAPALYPGGQYSYHYPSLPASFDFEPRISAYHHPPSRRSGLKRHYPSPERPRYRSPKPPRRKVEVVYPPISQWLASLDGNNEPFYALWEPLFHAQGYQQLDQLAATDKIILQETMEMPIDIAQALLRWARSDCIQLEGGGAVKRPRLNGMHPDF